MVQLPTILNGRLELIITLFLKNKSFALKLNDIFMFLMFWELWIVTFAFNI